MSDHRLNEMDQASICWIGLLGNSGGTGGLSQASSCSTSWICTCHGGCGKDSLWIWTLIQLQQFLGFLWVYIQAQLPSVLCWELFLRGACSAIACRSCCLELCLVCRLPLLWDLHCQWGTGMGRVGKWAWFHLQSRRASMVIMDVYFCTIALINQES